MNIALFKNHNGLVWGDDVKTIACDKAGSLIIGDTKINVKPNEEKLMPLLFHGASGDYPAKYILKQGEEYDLGKVSVRAGRVVPPAAYVVELMELRLRADAAEERIEELSKIFDTNSLNFLIK